MSQKIGPPPRNARLSLSYPGTLLTLLFITPLAIVLAVSFFRRVQTALFEPAFTFENYARALSPFFLERAAVTFGLAGLAALICVSLGFPFCYLLTRLPRRQQIPYLVVILAILSLSEIITAFAWSLLLSRTSGLSNILVWLRFIPEPVSWSPGFGAVLAGFVFIALPLTILTFYPTLARLDPELAEAAQTLGASPLRAFGGVTLPLMKSAIVGTWILVFVFVLGAYVVPQVLGRPGQWTLPVHITDQAVLQSNLPLAAALAILLLLASALLSLLASRLGSSEASL